MEILRNIVEIFFKILMAELYAVTLYCIIIKEMHSQDEELEEKFDKVKKIQGYFWIIMGILGLILFIVFIIFKIIVK